MGDRFPIIPLFQLLLFYYYFFKYVKFAKKPKKYMIIIFNGKKQATTGLKKPHI